MQQMFYPRSVAVIGVSPSRENLAKNTLQNIIKAGFSGDVWAVGASGGEVHGKPIYRSVADIPGQVDLATILIPARFVPQVLDECGQKGIRRVVISTGGFAEYSEQGKELQRQVFLIAQRHGIRFIGPNCIGITNMDNGLITTFAPLDPTRLIKGPYSIIAQSGGVASWCGSLFSDAGIGFNKSVSIGNKLNVDEVDLLEFLIEDASTQVIFMYLEDIRRGRDLLAMLQRSPKPVVIFKANVSPAAADAARSHTAALAAGDDRVIEGALRQAGAVRVRDLESFVVCAKAFSLPRCQGDNIVVISPSGGFAVIAADTAAALGFRLPKPPEHLVRVLEERSRAGVVRFTNPLDLGDVYDRTAMVDITREFLKVPNIAAVVATVPTGAATGGLGFSPRDAERLVVDLKEMSLASSKPVAAAVFAEPDRAPAMVKATQFPIFPTIQQAIQALAIQRDYWRNRAAMQS